MSRAFLVAQVREEKGKSSNQELRRSNRIPAVVYGGKDEPMLLSLGEAEAERFLNSHHVGSALDLVINDEKTFVLLKDMQTHAVTRKVLHMDFQRLMADVKIKVSIPIFLTGHEQVKDDAIVQELLGELEIETFPRYLIDSLSIDISGVEVGQSMSVADLPIFSDENYTVITSADSLVYNVIEPMYEEEEAEEEDVLEGEEVATEEAEEAAEEETTEEE